MNEVEMLSIMQYLEVCLPEPNLSQGKKEFEKYSYSRWAVFEIINRMMDKPFISAWDVIDNFILDMTYISFMTLDTKKDRICNISIDVAYSLLSFIGGEL